MTNNNLPHPQEVLDKFLERDRKAVEELQWSRPGYSIDARIGFTEARCEDTAAMVAYILRYLAKHHNLQHEHPNPPLTSHD
jgi:hypothetical protein